MARARLPSAAADRAYCPRGSRMAFAWRRGSPRRLDRERFHGSFVWRLRTKPTCRDGGPVTVYITVSKPSTSAAISTLTGHCLTPAGSFPASTVRFEYKDGGYWLHDVLDQRHVSERRRGSGMRGPHIVSRVAIALLLANTSKSRQRSDSDGLDAEAASSASKVAANASASDVGEALGSLRVRWRHGSIQSS